jgi:sugar phosphate permease
MAHDTTACLPALAVDSKGDTPADQRTTSTHRYAFFLLVFLMYTISYADRAALSIAMPELARVFALTPVEMGWISSSFLASYFLLNLPSTILVDIYGARLMGSVAVVLWSSAMIVGAWFRMSASSWPAVCSWAPERRRPLASGQRWSGTGPARRSAER